MRIYIGQRLTKRQGWIFGQIMDGKNAEEIAQQSRLPSTPEKIKREMQVVLDKTDFLGQARPDSYVMTLHAYQRLFERYPEGLLGYEIENMLDAALSNGRLISDIDGCKRLTHNDIIWVLKGNKVITVFWNNKEMRNRYIQANNRKCS